MNQDFTSFTSYEKGQAYESGVPELGIKQDYKQAFIFYSECVNQLSTERAKALFRLAYLYNNGYGVEKNVKKAQELIEECSKIYSSVK